VFRSTRVLATLTACVLLAASPPIANAQTTDATPLPVPTGTPAPTGFVGKGDLVIQSALAGVPLTVGGHVAFETAGSDFRLDILSFSFPGANSAVSSALGTQVLPPGGFTVVFDRTANTLTIWSSARRMYYTQSMKALRARANGGATPTPGPSPTGPDLATAFRALSGLRDDKTFTMSISLTGHTALFGHPVSNLHYELIQTPLATSGSSTDIHGELALAEDLDSFPVKFTASVAVKSIPISSLSLEFTELAKRLPPASDFAPPPDYTKATSIGDVMGHKLPI
jgi:hypothetical protein